jgi:regulator of protease activity HflC (stomatin/prohibitin superfamily)
MNPLVTSAHAAPAGPPAPPPPPPPPPAASAIQAQLDAEIAQARADAAQAMAEAQGEQAAAQAQAAEAQAEAAQARAEAEAEAQAEAAQVIAGEGRTISVSPDGVTVQRDGKTVTVLTDPPGFAGRERDDDGFGWVILPIAIVALVLMFRAFKHWTAVQAGYPIRWGKRTIERGGGAETARGVQLLSGENEKLRQQVARLEERVAVLERIATDPARRLGAEIDALR